MIKGINKWNRQRHYQIYRERKITPNVINMNILRWYGHVMRREYDYDIKCGIEREDDRLETGWMAQVNVGQKRERPPGGKEQVKLCKVHRARIVPDGDILSVLVFIIYCGIDLCLTTLHHHTCFYYYQRAYLFLSCRHQHTCFYCFSRVYLFLNTILLFSFSFNE